MKVSELKRLLKKHGCYKTDDFTNHENWYSPITGKEFLVLRHNSKEVASGTLHDILKKAGLK